MINRLRSAIRYIGFAGSPLGWRLHRHPKGCTLCGGRWQLALKPSAFMTRCIGCGSNLTNVALIDAIRQQQGHRLGDCYELSSFGATYTWLSRHARSLAYSEYFPDHAFGTMVNGIRNEDVQQLTFPDACFDLVTCNQVMEHVVDDLAGYREIVRVLRANGFFYMTVPLFDAPATEQRAKLVDGQIEWLGEPEYHDSRLGGPCSAPVFWRHAIADICERVMAGGFAKAELVTVAPIKGIQGQAVIVAQK